ncbi:MAG TPA: OsmC family protein [Nocardioidaceae bacterium]|nr:OsmC family protein [Nocardioidaceae bacterium]
MSVVEHVATHRRGTTEYRVNARADASGTAVIDAAGSPILFNGSWESAVEGLPGPAELLAGAFAACLLKNLSRSKALLDFEYDGAEVDVVVEREEKPPRIVSVGYTLRVTTDEPERRVELMHKNLRKFGTVYNTLAAVCDVDGSVEAVPRP